jgi:KaiC/GvpD/RAD55 family RecA-like ATPase
MAAGWLRTGGTVVYNATAQSPNKVRSQLTRHGIELAQLETTGKFSIIDFYTATLGQKSKEKQAVDSLRVADMSIYVAKNIMQGPADPDLLRLTDDHSVLSRFNDEKMWVEYLLTRSVPSVSMSNQIGVRAVMKNVHSDWVYKKLEGAHDGTLEFNLEEVGNASKDMMRIKTMRNAIFDREWHELKISDNFEVTLGK